jgi:hypothetical protein
MKLCVTEPFVKVCGFFILTGGLCYLGCTQQVPSLEPVPASAVGDVNQVLLAQDGYAVVDRAIAAQGGLAALEGIRNRTMTGTIDVTPLSVHGTFEIIQARPDKVYMKIETEGLGVIERGSDGTVFWERRSHGALRFFRGEELRLHLLTAIFDETTYRQVYRNVKSLGLEAVDGVQCYKVLLEPYQGPSIVNYYAKDSGLQVKTLIKVMRAGFSLPMETLVQDYRIVQGVQVAHTIIERSMGTETRRQLTEIAFNRDLPAGLFDPPYEPNASFENEEPQIE